MDACTWTVAVISANKFEGTIQCDLLKNAGARRVSLCLQSDHAIKECERLNPNIILLAMNAVPVVGLEWVKMVRRMPGSRVQRAAMFLISPVLTLSIAEECRVAGANAVIGLPVSGQTLLNTIARVLAKPRLFIESDIYVGPCRRAGIVTAGTGKRRRNADVEAA